MKDGRLTIRNVIVEGDRAAAHWTHTWTQAGDFLGRVPADGKQISCVATTSLCCGTVGSPNSTARC